MTDPILSRRSERLTVRRKLRTRRLWVSASALVAVVLVGLAAWVGIRGLTAKSDLESAQAMISTLKTQVADLDIAGASKTFDGILLRTENAKNMTSDPLWRTAEFFPWLGKNLTVVRELASVTDDVMRGVGGPLIDVAKNINPESFAPKDGAIDLSPFEEASPVLVNANSRLKSALAVAHGINVEGTISQVSGAKAKFVSLLDGVAPLLDTVAQVVPLLAPALGAEAPRTYVIMFQNPAEARALGGTALSFAVVKVDKGRIDLQAAIPAGFSNFDPYATSVVPIPDGAESVYPDGAFGTFIANATLRPSFTTAAEITQEMWKRQFGYAVDGIASIDPVALSYVLRATGPIPLATGDELSSTSLVPLLLNEVYLRYNSGNVGQDNLAQDVVYSAAVDATFNRLISGPMDPKLLMAALQQGWTEHRILFWSDHEDENAALIEVGRNGELPVSDKSTERFGVYFQDSVGSKLNYYLTSAVTLSQAKCAPGKQTYNISVDMTSTLLPDQVDSLSPSITGSWGREGLSPGQQRLIVYLYAPPGTHIAGATVNGEKVELADLHDTDYPVGRVRLIVEPGATMNLTYTVEGEPTKTKKIEAIVTPMVHATKVSTTPLDCTTVAPPAAP